MSRPFQIVGVMPIVFKKNFIKENYLKIENFNFCCNKMCMKIPNFQVDGIACRKCRNYSFCICKCENYQYKQRLEKIKRSQSIDE